MSVKKFRTVKEKQALMKKFLASGKPKTVWCKEMNIPLTTLSGWIQSDEKAKTEVCFIPLKANKKIEKDFPRALTDPVVSQSSLILEIGFCKIHVTESMSIPFLAEVLKTVKSSYV